MKRLLCLLLILSQIALPVFGASQTEIQQVKKFMGASSSSVKDEKTEKQKEEIIEPAVVAASEKKEISVVESAFGKPVEQFGYDIFRTGGRFSASENMPVEPDYVIGPGDAFNITLWGAAEGSFRVEVNQDGNITLPKVGVVHVGGISYGNLKQTIEQEFLNYYEKINFEISIANLKPMRVFIVGEVSRPGSYSLSPLSTVFNALFAAGGPTKKGSLRNIELKRGGRTVSHFDFYQFLLYGDKRQDSVLLSGDTIFVPLIGPTVGISGNVFRPAIYEIKGTADLSEVVSLAGGLLPTSYLNRVQIERVVNHDKKIIIDKKIMFSPNEKKVGIPLKNMDFVNIFQIYSEIGNMVSLEGSVKYPGPYELKEGKSRLLDILPSSASLTFSAYLPKAEIIRIDKNTLQTKVITVNLGRLFAGDETQNVGLESADKIVVFTEQKPQKKVELSGEVKLPGTYIIQKGERISSVLERAGGFTKDAYLYGAIFTRKSAQAAQQASLNKMLSNLEVSSFRKEKNVMPGMSIEEKSSKASEAENLRETIGRLGAGTMEGRVIIQLDYPERLKGTKRDIELEDGDKLIVPPVPSVVNVIGEVFTSSSLLYDEKLSVSDYLSQVGGLTKHADKGNIFILKSNGATYSEAQGYNVMAAKLYPGDSILVPEKTEKTVQVNVFSAIGDFSKWVIEVGAAILLVRILVKG